MWTYNQGSMIGAGVLLHSATGESRYRDEAVRTASASLERFDIEELMRQPAVFNAVLFRNLFFLGSVRADERYQWLARQYGEQMWQSRRLPSRMFTGTETSDLNYSAHAAGLLPASWCGGPALIRGPLSLPSLGHEPVFLSCRKGRCEPLAFQDGVDGVSSAAIPGRTALGLPHPGRAVAAKITDDLHGALPDQDRLP